MKIIQIFICTNPDVKSLNKFNVSEIIVSSCAQHFKLVILKIRYKNYK